MANRADNRCHSCNALAPMDEPTLLLVDLFIYCRKCDTDEIIERTKPLTGRLDRELPIIGMDC